MITMCFSNQKGGVGKSTSAITFAGILSRNYQVLIIDADPQGSVTEYFKLPYEPSLLNVFEKKSIRPLRVSTQLQVLSSHPKLASVDRWTLQGGFGLTLKEYLSSLKSIDFVIIDTSPSLGALMVNCLACAQLIILPTLCEPLSIAGMNRMLKTLSMMNHNLLTDYQIKILPVMVDKRQSLCKEYLHYLYNTFEQQVLPSIPLDAKLRQASFLHKLPHEFSQSSKAVQAYFEVLSVLNLLPIQNQGVDHGTSFEKDHA